MIASGRSDLGLLGTSDFGGVWSEDDFGGQSARVLLASAPPRPLFDWSGYGEGGAWFRVAGSFFQIYFGGLPNSGSYFAIGNVSTGATHEYSTSCLPNTGIEDTALDDSTLFYLVFPIPLVDGLPNYFARAPLSAPCDTAIVAELPKWSEGIAVDGNWLYTVVIGSPSPPEAYSLRAAPKTGGAAKIIASGVEPGEWLDYTTTIQAHDGNLAWTHAGADSRLHVLRATETASRTLVEPDGLGISENRMAIAIDDEYVYWTTTSGFVKRIRLCGGMPEVLASNEDDPIAVAVDDNAVYWLNHGTQPGTGAVMRRRKLDAPGYSDAGITDADASAKDADGGD